MIAVEELYKSAAETSGRPIIIFNGELDRIRSGCILFKQDISTSPYIELHLHVCMH